MFRQTKKTPFSKGDKLSNTTTRGTTRKGGYVGGKRERAELTWDKSEYTPRNLKKKDTKDLKKEYSRLRSIARKRLERFKGTRFESSDVYQKYKDKFKKVKELITDRELIMSLIELANYISSKYSTIKDLQYQEKNFISTMEERYPGVVDKSNYADFIEYMKLLREAGIKDLYDSERLLEYFEEIGFSSRKKMKAEDLKNSFESWYRSKNNEFKKWSNTVPITSSTVRKNLR